MWLELLGAVIQMAGGAAGRMMAEMDKKKAEALLKQSMDRFGNIQIPKLQALLLQNTPPTELAKIHEDPKYRGQLEAADAALGSMIQQGGLTLSDKAALNQIRNKVAAAVTSNRLGLEQSMSKRGTLDSGAQLASSLSNQQSAANQMNEAGQATAGQAQQRAYQAVLDRARMGTEGLNRDFNQKAQVASAQDAINAGNTAIQNTAAKYNAGIPQQNFNNEMEKAGAMSGQENNMANFYMNRAQDTQNTMGGIGKGLGQGVVAAGQPSYEDWLKSRNSPQGPVPDYQETAYSDPNEWNQWPGSSDPNKLGEDDK